MKPDLDFSSRRCFLRKAGLAGLAAAAALLGVRCSPSPKASEPAGGVSLDGIIHLPKPKQEGSASLEQALSSRRSVREFGRGNLTLEEIAQLLWAAQGVSGPGDKRTAPSAGALYPLEVHLAMAEGLYHYHPADHALLCRSEEDKRTALFNAALRQPAVRDAPVVFILSAVFSRTEAKYGRERTARYVHLEAGHAAQNLLLQATAIGLGAVPIGAFYDDQVQPVLELEAKLAPLYLIPVGRPVV